MFVSRTDFSGDNNLGLFACAAGKLCVAGGNVRDKDAAFIKEKLGVPVLVSTIAKMDFSGIFLAGNSKCMLVPTIAAPDEIKKIGEATRVEVLKTKYTALGNLILCNDKGAIVSELFNDRERRDIGSLLDVTVETSPIGGSNMVGSSSFANNANAFLHGNASSEERSLVEETLGVRTECGTANFGSPWIGSCMIGNDRGAITGASTTIHEIVRIEQLLGGSRA